jgi:lysophospholipase L1-like esterase
MNLNKIAGMTVAFLLLAVVQVSAQRSATPPTPPTKNLFPANHRSIQYTGRIDFSTPKKPKFWAPGVYFSTKFVGTFVDITVIDEMKGGTNHNSIAVSVDGGTPVVYTLKDINNKIKVASKLEPGQHTIAVCKLTESSVGFIQILNISCEGLMNLPLKSQRKIEFIGNSTTAGSGLDVSRTPCGKGQWYDQENAYESYGPVTARMLQAQWHLTALSGVGLMKSVNTRYTMPEVYDKMDASTNMEPWSFDRYHPDVITVCLGENDGVQDSTAFTSAYVKFIGDLREHHPKAHIVCLSSPIADASLNKVLQHYITGVTNYVNDHGDKNVSKFFFSRSYTSGCNGHPDKKEHQLIAKELADYIASTMQWTSL